MELRSHDEGRTCGCCFEHRPPVLEFERHHIWPLGLGGPDQEVNVVWVCPTTHANVHELLRLMLKAHRELTYRECQDAEDRTVDRYAHTLALDGYRRWVGSQLA